MKSLSLLLFLILVIASSSLAQSPFDGTWIVDTRNAKHPAEEPRSFLLADGVFRTGDRVLKADGKDQNVPATCYWDTINVRILDDRTVEVISKKAEKPMFRETYTVSRDGNTLTQVVEDMTEAETVTLKSTSRRVASATPGAHLLSGSWKVFKESRSRNASIIIYKCTSQGFSAATPLGERFDAKFDGKYYEMQDDPCHTKVSVKLINPNTVEMTNQRDGKVVFVVRLEVMPDGKTIHASSVSKEDGSVKSWELHKQLK